MTKKMLIRGGQMVGFERTYNDVTERSYDGFVWVTLLNIPHDSEKDFIEYDTDLLQEIYEA